MTFFIGSTRNGSLPRAMSTVPRPAPGVNGEGAIPGEQEPGTGGQGGGAYDVDAADGTALRFRATAGRRSLCRLERLWIASAATDVPSAEIVTVSRVSRFIR